MSRTDDFEHTLSERLHELAADVAPSDDLFERSRSQARRAIVGHRVRRYAVPAAAVLVVVAAIGAMVVATNREPSYRILPADPPPTTVVPPTTVASPPTTTTTSPPATDPPLDPLAGLPDVDVVITPESRTAGDLAYDLPTFAVTIDGRHSDPAQAIEDDLRSTVDSMASYSLQLHEDWPVAEFQITALVDGVTDRTVSVRVEAYLYYEGGAHGGRLPKTRTYELSTGRAMTLDELFRPDVEFLTALATPARERLALMTEGGAVTQSAAEGTEPRPENYDVWAILPEGLEITFEEYQVGPYAIGQPTVVIPWSALSGVLGDWVPGGVVAPWAGGLVPDYADLATLQQVADQQFAAKTELRSVRRWSDYLLALVVMPNHTISPIAVKMDDPPAVVALGTDGFGCDTLPAEAVEELYLPCD